MTAKIIVHDEVKCSIVGISDRDKAYLVKKHAIKQKNHYFNPRFQVGAWDGNINFFSENGGSYVYLLPSIATDLVAMGYSPDIVDKRQGKPCKLELIDKDVFSSYLYPETGEPIELAEHQVRSSNALLNAGAGIVVAATGAGKTFIIGALCLRLLEQNLKTLIIVPNLDLIGNTRAEFRDIGLDTTEFSGTEKNLSGDIVVSTWQSLKNVPIAMKEFSAVIVDETHQAKSPEIKKLLVEFGSHIIHRFGVTGTMPDDACDRLTVHTAIGDVLETVPASELIAIGWLATLNIEITQLNECLKAEYAIYLTEKLPFGEKRLTYKQFKNQYFPDYASEKAYLQQRSERHQWLANKVAATAASSGNSLVLVNGVDVGKELASMIPGAIFVHGADKTKVRQQIYALFQEHDNLTVVATVHIASTGINIKRIFNLFLYDLGKSFVRTIQSIGRGLRKGRGKTHVVVHDVSSDLKYGTKHMKDRIKYYKQAQYPYAQQIVDY